MKSDFNLEIHGLKTVLVPYEKHLVGKYHEWMQSEQLREDTASEYLTWEEENAVWKSWVEDENKCTLIILDKALWETGYSDVDSMIGDINFFMQNNDKGEKIAEVMIMIAPCNMRRKGFATEALSLMLTYGMEELKITKFTAKISYKNPASLRLFEKFDFYVNQEIDFFEEITLNRPACKTWCEILKKTSGYLKLNKNDDL